MNILALETTGKYGSVAVISGEGKVFSAVSAEEMNHLKGMIDLVDEAIKSSRRSPRLSDRDRSPA